MRKEVGVSLRSWRLLPRTTPGKWTVALVAAMLLLFVFGSSISSFVYFSVPAGETILEDARARPLLAGVMLAGMAAGISAFIGGLFVIIKREEKALLVYLSTLIGGLFTLLLAGDLAFPH
jgi:hypothetical protein